MRSRGYAVEAFSSAADFLASSLLAETACLIADVQMPGMTGPELYRHLIASENEILTNLVMAYVDGQVRARSLKDGVVCHLRKPVDERYLQGCLHAARRYREPTEDNS